MHSILAGHRSNALFLQQFNCVFSAFEQPQCLNASLPPLSGQSDTTSSKDTGGQAEEGNNNSNSARGSVIKGLMQQTQQAVDEQSKFSRGEHGPQPLSRHESQKPPAGMAWLLSPLGDVLGAAGESKYAAAPTQCHFSLYLYLMLISR